MSPAEPAPDQGAPIGRRAFLGFVGLGVSSLAWGGAAMDLVAQSTRLVPESLRAALPFGKGWRIYAVNPPHPTFDPATWRLRIEGLVERPQTLTYAQLRALPRAPDAMLAYAMDGRPLERKHGAPARLVMPQMYGYKGVKWVSKIVVTDRIEDGYWQQRGYDRDAWIGGSNGR
jgi:DMSO/TMAO reductase YedYZ molybdopterin-dependent catalytic subunit